MGSGLPSALDFVDGGFREASFDAAKVRLVELSPAQDFAAGAVGGICECVSGHPLDTVKVRLQTAGAGPLPSVWGTFRGIAEAEGFAGLYRGVSSPLAGLVLINAVMFSSYEVASRGCTQQLQTGALQTAFLAGMASGAASTVVESPVDLIKVQLQRERAGQPRLYRGYFDCFAQVFRTNGLAGFYQGASATLSRNVPGQAFHFLAYEATLMALAAGGEGQDLTPSKVLAAGSMAGLALWVTVYPMDVLKTVLQSQPLERRERSCTLADCARWHVCRYGVSGIWVGFNACVIRSVPSTAACFLGYEATAAAMRQCDDN
jgi:solute carrier family 25 carnitine/acylcarnitine transporter 20/29